MNELTATSKQTMSSLEIAGLTGTDHRHVLEKIRKTLEECGIDSAGFSAQYKDSTGRGLPCFNLPRRECDLIIAGYSAKYRLAIIDRWQELESQQSKPLAIVNPQTAAMMLLLQNYDRMEQQQAAQAIALADQSSRMDSLEAKTSAVLDGSRFYSVAGFASLHGIKVDIKAAAAYSRKATAESKALGIMIGSLHDPRFGRVHSYHQDVLASVFAL